MPWIIADSCFKHQISSFFQDATFWTIGTCGSASTKCFWYKIKNTAKIGNSFKVILREWTEGLEREVHNLYMVDSYKLGARYSFLLESFLPNKDSIKCGSVGGWGNLNCLHIVCFLVWSGVQALAYPWKKFIHMVTGHSNPRLFNFNFNHGLLNHRIFNQDPYRIEKFMVEKFKVEKSRVKMSIV